MQYFYLRPRIEMSAGKLSEEIKSTLGYDTRIRIGTDVWIQFEAALTPEEKATLDTVVANHTYTIPPSLIMSLHEARILSIDVGPPPPVRPIKVRIFQNSDIFDIDCFVTQDLIDAYLDGKLNVDDWVLVYFIDKREDKAIVQQKILKTW